MKTKPVELKILIFVLVLLASVILHVSAESLLITDDQPVADADTYFKLNEGVPVHVKTNDTGIAIFKPLVTGTLKITVQKDTFEQ